MDTISFIDHFLSGTVPQEDTISPLIKIDTMPLPVNLEEILEKTKCNDGWRGLPFFPKPIINTTDRLLYLAGRDKPLTDHPINGFYINNKKNQAHIYNLIVDYE
ncbi:MAG: hypothetical protein AABX16_02030 [Nanoarchaeota archaeon]